MLTPWARLHRPCVAAASFPWPPLGELPGSGQHLLSVVWENSSVVSEGIVPGGTGATRSHLVPGADPLDLLVVEEGPLPLPVQVIPSD